jgi:DNA-binding transcriptional LysR family regulator
LLFTTARVVDIAMKMPSPVHIETICCIGRVRTFTAAALCLHTTQSAISSRVRDVEELLGVELFQRNGRTVELTPEGRRFVDTAEPILQRLTDFVESFQNPAVTSGRIRIGVSNSGMGRVAVMLKKLQEAMPDLSYDIISQATTNMARELELSKIDLAVFATSAKDLDRTKILSHSLGFEPMQWLISPQLIKELEAGKVHIQEKLDRFPLWCAPKPTGHFEVSVKSIQDQGGVIKRLNTSNNMPAMVDIIVEGGGIGLLTDRTTKYQRDAGHLVPAFGDLVPPSLEFYIACSRERHSVILRKIMDVAMATMPRDLA